MVLTFEKNRVVSFDVKNTFGTMNYLSKEARTVFDSEGNNTGEIEEYTVTIYSEAKADQVEITLPADFDFKGIEYDDEIELVGEITATGWLHGYTGYNDSAQSEQGFKVRADGLKKVVVIAPIKNNDSEKEKLQK